MKPVQSQLNDPSSPFFSYGYSYTGSGDVIGVNVIDLTLVEEDTSPELADKSLPAKDVSLSSLSSESNVKLCLGCTPVVSLKQVSTPAKIAEPSGGSSGGFQMFQLKPLLLFTMNIIKSRPHTCTSQVYCE